MENENLTNDPICNDNASIVDDAAQPSGSNEQLEKPTDANALIIEQLREQNAAIMEQNKALMEQNKSLNSQIVQMVRDGSAQVGNGEPSKETPMIGSMLWEAEHSTWDDLGRDAIR